MPCIKCKNGKWRLKGFTLIEILIVIAIIGTLATIIAISVFGVREKARDSKRKVEISQIGKVLTLSCYMPDEGAGSYDIAILVQEIFDKYPDYRKYISEVPKDPKSGTETESKYFYIISEDGKKCAVYANLENSKEPVSLSITIPTPGGGTGVLKADDPGWNNTPLYYQYSN